MVCGDDVRPIGVVWTDKDGQKSMRLEGLHMLITQDPALGLAVLCRLKEWEHSRMWSKLWGPSRPCKPSRWAHLANFGWLGCEDGRIWREIGGEEA